MADVITDYFYFSTSRFGCKHIVCCLVRGYDNFRKTMSMLGSHRNTSDVFVRGGQSLFGYTHSYFLVI